MGAHAPRVVFVVPNNGNQEKYRSRSCSSFTTGDCTERRDRTAAGRTNGRARRRVLGRGSCGLPFFLGIEKAARGRPSWKRPAVVHGVGRNSPYVISPVTRVAKRTQEKMKKNKMIISRQ